MPDGPPMQAAPRSCVTCRKRKVKCDKRQPCSHCARAKIECVFPGPGRAPRKRKKPQDGELMDRLRRLEGVVQSLNAQVEDHEQEAAEREREHSTETPAGPQFPRVAGSRKGRPIVSVDNTVDGLETRFGRLVVDQGRSRYINNSFWASLANEVEDLKTILADPSDDEDGSLDSPTSPHSSQPSFIFGYSSANVDLLSLHPQPDHALALWSLYKDNVDPLVKVLHLPTFDPVFVEACKSPDKIPRKLESLIFTIYYSAVTSLLPDECIELCGEDRATLLGRYRFGLEQGLARANFLCSEETVVLQALTVFLILLRRNDETRKIYTMTGMAVRIAQTIGIHRDGSHFQLSPFEIEMRRRLWWQVCILDARASEDYGCDSTIHESQFDTKMPLNINDCDIHPDMKDFPEERTGFTDMTFGLIRFEVTNIFRRILYVPPAPNHCNEYFANLGIAEKEKWISDCHQRLEDKYLRVVDMTVPMYWVTATIARLVMSKMWLIVYHPHQRRDGGASLPQETKDKLFITSLENVEYSILLETESRTMKWGWLFRTHVQWHAIAYLLSELCVRTKGEAVDRAWRALEASQNRWWFPLAETNYRKRQGSLWSPLKKLLHKAKAARQRELALEAASNALRNAGEVYTGRLLNELPESAPSDRPCTESLDKMLRPAAPKLGEMPIAKPPYWAGSTALPDTPSPSASVENSMRKTPKSSALANDFQNMRNYGLDFVLDDVMQDMPYEDASLYYVDNSSRQSYHPPQQDTNVNTISELHGLNGNGVTKSADTMFPVDLNDTTTGINPANLSSTSPALDTDPTTNWAEWDDLVRKYGMDGMQTSPGLSPQNNIGYMGEMSWF